MGLRFPSDLAAWQRWQDRRHLLRHVAARVLRRGGGSPASSAWIARNTTEPARVLVVIESRAASSQMAVLEPIVHLGDAPVAVVAAFDPAEQLPGWTVTRIADYDPARHTPDVRVVVSAAHFLPIGAAAYAFSRTRGIPYATVQHGLLAPSVPPLPPHGHLLAWTQADADFWRSGRADVPVSVVGSQLFHNAAREPAGAVSTSATPTYLGQLHGAELPRAGMTLAVTRFCLTTGATYRPHPSETDRLSLLQHRLWERLGIPIDRSRVPLAQTSQPVVAAFSTGILEAAARGVPSWVSYPGAPAWLRDFWERYEMARWGGEPTPPPALADVEPARAVAEWTKERL